MTGEARGQAWTPDRPRPRHVLAALSAVVLSAALHFEAARHLPHFPVGRLAQVREDRRIRSVALGDVKRDLRVAAVRPAQFRPEDPGRRGSGSAAPDVLAGLADVAEPFLAPPTPALEGRETAMAVPALTEGQGAWSPRQEILEIEEGIHAEDVRAAPRRVSERAPRVAKAPDIVLAAAGDDRTLGAFDAGIDGAAGPEDLGLDRDAAAQGAGQGAGGASGLGEAGDLLGEERDEVTAAKPVEHLLSLATRIYRPADDPETGFLEIRISRRGDNVLPVLPRDVLLIQDCSESMTQSKLNECKAGLREWVERVGADDRFDLMGFREEPYRCFGHWTNSSPVTRARANQFIDEMISRGRTDVYASLEELMKIRRSAARPVVAVLVSDGRPTLGMVDSSDIIEKFRQVNAGRVSVLGVGGGKRVNRFLLDLIAYGNRGDSLIADENSGIPGAMKRWAEEFSRPVLADLEYRFAGLEGVEAYPATLTHLYLDRPLVVYARCARNAEKGILRITGRAGEDLYDMVFDVDVAAAPDGGAEIRTRWVWHRIYALIGEYIETRKPEIMDEVNSLAAQNNLLVPYGGEYPLP